MRLLSSQVYFKTACAHPFCQKVVGPPFISPMSLQDQTPNRISG